MVHYITQSTPAPKFDFQETKPTTALLGTGTGGTKQPNPETPGTGNPTKSGTLPTNTKPHTYAGRSVVTYDGGKTFVFKSGNKDITIKPKDEADLIDQIQKHNAGVYDTVQVAIGHMMASSLAESIILYYQDLAAGKYDDKPWAAKAKLTLEQDLAAAQKVKSDNDKAAFALVGHYKDDYRKGMKPVDLAEYGNPSTIAKQRLGRTDIRGADFGIGGRSVSTFDGGETYVLYHGGKYIKLKASLFTDPDTINENLLAEVQQFNLANPSTLNISPEITGMEGKISAAKSLIPFLQQVQSGQWDAFATNGQPVMGKPLSEWKAQIAAGKIAELQGQIASLQPQVDSYYDGLFGKGKRP